MSVDIKVKLFVCKIQRDVFDVGVAQCTVAQSARVLLDQALDVRFLVSEDYVKRKSGCHSILLKLGLVIIETYIFEMDRWQDRFSIVIFRKRKFELLYRILSHKQLLLAFILYLPRRRSKEK